MRIQNANGSVTQLASMADSMMNNGVKVLMIVNLDNTAGTSIEKKA